MTRDIDAVVVGAGHAGVEAAAALARLGRSTLLITLRSDRIAWMSCNPSVGGLAKGHVVREVDALGGLMGSLADRAGLQFRRLNIRKGPAVRSTRVQVDMEEYSRLATATLAGIPGLEIREDEVLEVLHRGGRVTGIRLAGAGDLACRVVILTTGTFLSGRVFIGEESWEAGRMDEPPSTGLSANLSDMGFSLIRLKTGTPARLHRDSVDFSKMERQDGDVPPPFFHWGTSTTTLPQVPCWVTYTTPQTHDVIRGGLHRSPLFTGKVTGVGPRYCPSIEDKVVRFPDRERHQIFMEPVGLHSDQMYPAGISSSLPRDVQDAMLHSIPGLRDVRVLRYAYGIEYDAIQPTALHPTLEARSIRGLFTAGQINGTSGYEEAAGQGILAGINAARLLEDATPVILRRDEAYIGVMVDDLTSLGTNEPYRLFTSRAEHRLLLREANAGRRLTPLGREVGLVGDAQWEAFEATGRRARSVRVALEHRVPPPEVDAWAVRTGTKAPGRTIRLQELIQRPEVCLEHLRDLVPELPYLSPVEVEDLEAELKFDGYIRRQEKVAQRVRKADELCLPEALRYDTVEGLSAELKEKLAATRPRTLGAAARLPGVTPAALASILFHLQSRSET
ncbi:MAG: tRNA uridine-5-carboxymethylaminomethyl(34) synthesis enzyme MnmG [Pseudomonadota bacterium]